MTQKINQILIIADDLSGAADCTAGAVRAGLLTQVSLGHALAENAVAPEIQVWSIDTDTRRLEPADAAKINAEILSRCRKPGQLLYKKIDSTLRGNFAAELLPMLARSEMAVVAPAFPDAGRSTRNGRQYVDGVALEETEIWRHEGISGIADIQGMLSAQGIRTALLRLDQVRAGHPQLRKNMEDCMAQGMQAVVCDAETNEDLQRITQASIALSPSIFWVGSAGLANQLPKAAGLIGHAQPPGTGVNGAILTAVGSMSAISRQQMHHLSVSRAMTRIDIRTDMLSDGEHHRDWDIQQSRLRAAFENGDDVLLAISDAGYLDIHQGWMLCQALARLVSPFSSCIGGMISTGGETTHALLSAFKSTGLHIIREIQPGIPLSVTLGARTFPIITKAGAFGTAQTLVYCYDALQRMRPESTHGAHLKTEARTL